MLDELAHLQLAVADLSASRALYGGELGLVEMGSGRDANGCDFCLFAVGPSILELRQDPAARSRSEHVEDGVVQPPVADHYALLVDDMDSTYATLKNRDISFLNEPTVTPIGHRNMQRALLAFEDPDGLHVQISETVDPRPQVEDRRAAKRRMSKAGPGGPFGGFDHVSTYCVDFAAAREFYGTHLEMDEFFHSATREAGETVKAGFAQAAFAVGGTDIELATAPLESPLQAGHIRKLTFSTSRDLDAACRQLRDRGVALEEPSEWTPLPDVRWRSVDVRSADGLVIGIASCLS